LQIRKIRSVEQYQAIVIILINACDCDFRYS